MPWRWRRLTLTLILTLTLTLALAEGRCALEMETPRVLILTLTLTLALAEGRGCLGDGDAARRGRDRREGLGPVEAVRTQAGAPRTWVG